MQEGRSAGLRELWGLRRGGPHRAIVARAFINYFIWSPTCPLTHLYTAGFQIYILSLCFFQLCFVAGRILVPKPGIKLRPSSV